MSIVATLLLGPAPPATAADRDFILTLNASDLGMDPADLRDIVPEMQADITEHGGPGPAIKQTPAAPGAHRWKGAICIRPLSADRVPLLVLNRPRPALTEPSPSPIETRPFLID
ncbi:hypothetical protein [Nonomuraea sp. NPDC003709]|uniref:hypothetical protein n=1 Tax=Nonomuraea sp. NPDC003709 TaxID=3154450 RepID=UPI00339DB34A